MKKRIISIVIIAVVLLSVIRLFTMHPQSSVAELKIALVEIFKEAKALQDSNYYSSSSSERKYVEWDIYTRQSNNLMMDYQQDKDGDNYYDDEWTLNFSIFLHSDGEKIVFHQYESGNFSRGGISSFGSAYHCYREFHNADDFRKKIGKFIQDREDKISSTKDLEIKDYYPAISWRNLMLSFKDNNKDYGYSY